MFLPVFRRPAPCDLPRRVHTVPTSAGLTIRQAFAPSANRRRLQSVVLQNYGGYCAGLPRPDRHGYRPMQTRCESNHTVPAAGCKDIIGRRAALKVQEGSMHGGAHRHDSRLSAFRVSGLYGDSPARQIHIGPFQPFKASAWRRSPQ
jgi:hypothetical protein